MTRFLGASAWLAAILVCGSAHATVPVPDPAHCTLDGDFVLANARGLSPAAVGGIPVVLTDGYDIIVRDGANLPLVGSVVTLKLGGSGLRPHASQTGGQQADCSLFNIYQVTNALGHAVLNPAAVGENEAALAGVAITADGVFLGRVIVRSFDLHCGPGTTAAVDGFDFNEFRLYFLGLKAGLAADFTNSGVSPPSGFALNAFRTEFLCSATGIPTGPVCTQTS